MSTFYNKFKEEEKKEQEKLKEQELLKQQLLQQKLNNQAFNNQPIIMQEKSTFKNLKILISAFFHFYKRFILFRYNSLFQYRTNSFIK